MESPLAQENDPQLLKIASQCYCNLAAVLFDENVDDALRSSDLSIKYNSKWAKPFYRRALCFEKRREWKPAYRDLKIAVAFEPTDITILQTLNRLETNL